MAKKHKKDPDTWLIKRNRDGDTHIKNCSRGYNPRSSSFRQVHHVLPVTSLSDGTISTLLGAAAKFKLIRTCLQVTDWDINASPNCVGLPLKRAFGDARAPNTWDGWPCHQVDHPPYTNEVNSDLKDSIWDPVCAAAKKCEFEVTDLLGMLQDREEFWFDELKERGGRKKGTKYCWKHRDALDDTWYIPFSMASSPTKRSPPKDWKKFSGSLQAYLQKIFTAL
jgi:hypothetical protein